MRGFTLVELLVVVAILVLLLAMLVPSLREAREQAMRAVCLTNQRSIVLAGQMYARDNDGLFPRTDGSWISRHKNGPDNPQGIGLLYTCSYLPLTADGVRDIAFCPSAVPKYNWRFPSHLYKELTTQLGSNNWAKSTYSGKFCTFVGYNTETNPTQANLYLFQRAQTPARLSPILVADYVFNHEDPALQVAEQGSIQAHRARGLNGGFHDGAARWIPFEDIYPVTWGGVYNNENPYGNFWHWAKAEFGQP